MLKEAQGKALKAFLLGLQDAGFQNIQIDQYLKPPDKFLKQEDVEANLGKGFEIDCIGVNTALLSSWSKLGLKFIEKT